MKTMTQEQMEEILEDSGNSLFGRPFPEIRRMIYEYLSKGVDPQELVRLRFENLRLRAALEATKGPK